MSTIYLVFSTYKKENNEISQMFFYGSGFCDL